MLVHGTIARIGGIPDKQGHIWASSEGIDVQLLGKSLSKELFGADLGDLLPGTKITQVVKHPGRIDIEVEIGDDIYERYYRLALEQGPMYFALAGKILGMERPLGVEIIKKAVVNQLAFTLHGVDPAYVVQSGPLGS